MRSLKTIASPQLEKIHSGKVRESFRVDDSSRLIVATDRISCFDFVLDTPVPAKGAVLNSLAAFWFEKTKDVIGNHLIKVIDPSISLVKEAKPIPVEMIVRGYLTGSAWRGYQAGRREVSGVPIADGMHLNQAFEHPIVTPTTKEKNDREISAQGLFDEGWVTPDLFEKMKVASLQLFERGSEFLAQRGIILVDTKYEFGLVDGELILIDEIHTPDSSRFWNKEDYDRDPAKVEQLDKEFVRSYLMENKVDGAYARVLPEEIVAETTRRYLSIYEKITGQALSLCCIEPLTRIRSNLLKEGMIKDGYVAIVMGSPVDVEHCRKIKSYIDPYGVACELRVVSAHKNGERLPEVIRDLHESVEPVAVIAVAGRSNGLGGALAANLSVPVISCPPFSDRPDLLINLHSSILMPSSVPNMTVIDPQNAAHGAMRSLNLPRLREIFAEEIRSMKADLAGADAELRFFA